MNRTSLRQAMEAYSARIGSDPLLVQGAGGNASWKEDGVLWIKASGTWLKDALDQDIFVPVDLTALQSSLRQDDFAHTPKVIGESTLRPSIETLLHGLMPHTVVLHAHAIEVLSAMVRSDPAPALEQHLADYDYRWATVSYQKPGADLAKEVALAIRRDPSLDVILMANHGVVIGGSSAEDVDEKLHALGAALASIPLEPVNNGSVATPAAPETGYVRVDDEGINQLAVDPRLFERLEQDWALYPDHVVFLGAQPCVIEDRHSGTVSFLAGDSAPEIVFCKNVGVFSQGELNAAKRAQLRCYYDVLARQSPGQELAALSQQAVASLLNWDAETYRQSIAK